MALDLAGPGFYLAFLLHKKKGYLREMIINPEKERITDKDKIIARVQLYLTENSVVNLTWFIKNDMNYLETNPSFIRDELREGNLRIRQILWISCRLSTIYWGLPFIALPSSLQYL